MADPDASTEIHLRGFTTGPDDPRNRPLPTDAWEPEETRQYLVEFKHSLGRDERRQIQVEFGLRLDAYIPPYTYLESIDEEAFLGLPAHPLVKSIFPFEAANKMAPGIGRTRARSTARQALAGLLLRADLAPDADPAAVASELRQLGATQIHVLDDRGRGGFSRIEFVAEPDIIPAITALDDIRWVEEVPELSSNSGIPIDYLETGQPLMAPARANGLRGAGQIVGVIDQGSLHRDHCWFQHAVNATGAPGPLHRKLAANNDIAGLGIGEHPTFVAGIVAGDDVTNPGAAPIRGVACDTRLTFGNRIDFESGTGLTFYQYLMYAAVTGASVVNTSWHALILNGDPEYGQYAADVDRFTWENENCLVAGSSGNNGERRGPPGSAKNSLCVSAAYVDAHGSCLGDGVAGPTQDGRRKPDLLAPGCAIESASTDTTTCRIDLDDDIFNNPYAINPTCAGVAAFCGASFATPVAAAAAAIVRQYFAEGWYPSGKKVKGNERTPSAALLKAALLTATDKTKDGASYPSNDEGWGLLQLDRILRLPGGTRKLRVWDIRNAAGLDKGQSRTRFVNIKTADKPLKVTLVWTEPPGVANSLDPVVNDLDLEVESPSGSIYLGNHFPVPNNESAIGGNPDRRNNVEMVFRKNAEAGNWRITVRAHEVNVGGTGQGYALVVRGALG